MKPLLPFQKTGVEFLASRTTAYLADEMGAGKTVQTIRALDTVYDWPVLIICPAIARGHWAREIAKWSVFSPDVYVVETSQDTALCTGVNIVSFNLAIGPDHVELLAQPWGCVVIDEAHYLKSARAKRTKIILKKTVRQARRVWCLSGTPAPNHAGELYPIVATLFPGALTDVKKGYDGFVRRFCKGYNDGFSFRITGSKNIPLLRSLLKPYLLRRLKKDVTTLPELEYRHYAVDAGQIAYTAWFPEHRFGEVDDVITRVRKQEDIVESVFNQATFKKDTIPSLDGLGDGIVTWRRWTGLAKVHSGIRYCDWLFERGVKKLVVMCWHRDVIKEVVRLMPNRGATALWGGTPAKKRDKIIWKFQNDYKMQVVVCQIAAAGIAIDLTAAHHIVFFETDWVPGNNAQAVMRCHRLGQEKKVVAHFLSLRNSVDQKISRAVERKTRELVELFD